MPVKTALIPLDGTRFSSQIVPQVARLYSPTEYKLMLLRVGAPVNGLVGQPPRPVSLDVPVPLYQRDSDLAFARHPIYATQAEASAVADLETSLLREKKALEQRGFAVEIEVRFGDPAEEIINVARAYHVDVVAMATHERNLLEHFLVGSVAEHVLHQLHIPVLLLHPQQEQS
ncbi:MAG: universal stress protein [Chloroflexaceae bacterium]|jgi:nucleotide-binding universal stress UspA family protein|nr:universal stress protein [Chloroflexaceae bacterium]